VSAPTYLYTLSLHDALPISSAAPAGTNAHDIHRSVADVVVQVANKILGRHFPVALDAPFLHAAYELRPALATIAMVERGVQVQADRKSTRLNSSHVKISYAV